MAVLGISIALISVSVLFYRHPPASWQLFSRFFIPWWRGRLDSRKTLEDDRNITLEGEAEKKKTEKDGQEIFERTAQVRETLEPKRPTITTTVPEDVTTPSPQSTPKATHKSLKDHNIPTLNLDASQTSEKTPVSPDRSWKQDPPPTKRSPVLSRSSPAPHASTNQLSCTGMLPPPRPSSLRPLPSAASTLRAPAAGPLPNRSPTAPSTSSLSLPPSMTTKPEKPRQKVMLTPGHSPLDWARLQKSGTDLRGVATPRLIPVAPSMLRRQNGRKGKDAWSVWQGKVYNITPYLPFHPGGENELMKAAGRDGSKLFMEIHPWVNWENMLGQCLVGVLIDEPVAGDTAEASLDQMD